MIVGLNHIFVSQPSCGWYSCNESTIRRLFSALFAVRSCKLAGDGAHVGAFHDGVDGLAEGVHAHVGAVRPVNEGLEVGGGFALLNLPDAVD